MGSLGDGLRKPVRYDMRDRRPDVQNGWGRRGCRVVVETPPSGPGLERVARFFHRGEARAGVTSEEGDPDLLLLLLLLLLAGRGGDLGRRKFAAAARFGVPQ